MKITQTDNQMEIKTSGIPSIIAGVIVILIGLAVVGLLIANGFKDSSGKSSSILIPILGLVFAVVGVFCVIFAANRDIILQKGGTSSVSSKRIFGGKLKSVSFETKRIIAVSLMTGYQMTGSGNASNPQRESQLSLVLDDNSLVKIGQKSGSGGFSLNGFNISGLITKAPLGKQADQISAFLGVPLQSSRQMTTIASIANVVEGVSEAVHENSQQNQILSEKPTVVSQPAAGIVPAGQPTIPVEPTVPPQNNNWQS
jgi:hypothetical protein